MIRLLGVDWRLSLFLIPAVLAGGIAIALAYFSWHNRDRRAARSFTALLIGIGIWAAAYAFQLAATADGPTLLFYKLTFVGSGVVPAAWLVLALEYAGYESWLTRRTVALLAIEPVVALVLVATNGVHELFWRGVSLTTAGPLPVVDLDYGLAYWLNFWYSYALVGVGLMIFASVVVHADRIHRRQSVAVFVGGLVPFIANGAFHLVPGLNPVENLDLTTAAFAVTGICFGLALFHYRFLDVVPEARATLVETIDDGVVVIDADGTILDCNPAATPILGPEAIGSHVSKTPIGTRDGIADGFLSIEVDGEARSYDVRSTAISDFRDDEAGQFVLMRDITRLEVLREQEQRLSVLNRILRHNIRNEMNVIAGRAALLETDLDRSDSPHLAAVRRATDRILELSDKARHVESAVEQSETADEAVDVVEHATATADAVRSDYPSAEITVDAPAESLVLAPGDEHVSTILEVLVENAVVHNTSESPRVRVSIDRFQDSVRAAVADDGPGIPAAERSILDQDEETPLEHGAGLGLWLVTWLSDAANADVSFVENDCGGSTVVVEFRRSDPVDADD